MDILKFPKEKIIVFFNWRDNYNVGIPLMGSQYKRMAGYLDFPYEVMQAGIGNEASSETLTNDTKTHFIAEEKLVQAHQCPGFPNHYRQHEAFAKKLK